jgi:hypothetical protein
MDLNYQNHRHPAWPGLGPPRLQGLVDGQAAPAADIDGNPATGFIDADDLACDWLG